MKFFVTGICGRLGRAIASEASTQGHTVVGLDILETALRVGIRHVALSSTMEVLMGRDWTTSGAVVVDEDFPPRTDSAYSLSRQLQEQLGREFSRRHG